MTVRQAPLSIVPLGEKNDDFICRTRRIVTENIVFALGVKAAVLALGAAGLAGMWLAVFADVGVCVLAVLNAMRMLRRPAR